MFSNAYYGPFPNTTTAYHNDGTHEWYGRAAKGSKTTDPRWAIVKMEYNTGYSVAADPWILKYPDGLDEPKYKWSDVESLTYKLLGT